MGAALSARLRVVLADDHALILPAMRIMVERIEGVSVVGELATAIAAISAGNTYLSPSISHHVMSGLRRPGDASESPIDALTARQREVLQMIAEGNSTKEIAFALDLSVKTAETHRGAIMERLGIHDIAGLALFAARHGLVELDRSGGTR